MNHNRTIIITFLCLFSLCSKAQVTPLLPNPTNYQIVFQDEFDASAMDWNVWGSEDAISTRSSGQTVGRWKENAVLANGLLKLMIKKGNRTDSQWTAGNVYVKQLFGSNTYYESRFRITNAPGVNNAFWTACITQANNVSRSYKNHYEIDVVEAKLNNAGDTISGHLAWHDWKPYSYSNATDIASGIIVNSKRVDFQTWGLWLGEDNFIIYCDGVEQWRGTTNPIYPNQWKTGVGKIAVWPTLEEKRAYGKWGQTDWNYTGGLNGDDMNIVLSNTIMTDPNSTFTDVADNTSMDIDYMRIFKLKTDLNTVPTQTVLAPKAQQVITLTNPINLNTNQNYYFGFVANHPFNSLISCAFHVSSLPILTFKVKADNELAIFDNTTEVSSGNSYPATAKIGTHFEAGRKYLIVGRISASTTAKDILSMTSFDLGDSIPAREPFLYKNVDALGNSSFSNEWTINKKINSTRLLNQLVFTDVANNCEFSDLMLSTNYASIISKFQNLPRVNFYGETKPSNKRYVYFNLQGKFPFSVIYTDGIQQFTVNNIAQSADTIAVSPVGVSQYSIVSATDADGKSAIVDGSANFYGNDANFLKIAPSFDTYLTEGSTVNSQAAADMLIKNLSGSAQESFLVFKLPDIQTNTDRANLVIYYTSKSIVTPTEIELLGSTALIDSTTRWSSAAASTAWESIEKKVLASNSGYYIDFDLTSFCNARFANNQRTFSLKIRQTLGDSTNVMKLKQTHNATTSVPTFMMVKKPSTTSISDLYSTKPQLCLNPSSRQLINCSEVDIVKVSIYSLEGKLLHESTVLPIDISNFRTGVFILKIATQTQVFVQKLKI